MPSTWVFYFIMPDSLYFQTETLSIHCDDIITTARLSKNAVDLIVTSPPYNLGISYRSYHDRMTEKAYQSFTRQWLEKCCTRRSSLSWMVM